MPSLPAGIRRSFLVLGAFFASMLAIAAPAQAAGMPDLQLSGGPAPSVLYGHHYTVSLTTSIIPPPSRGYNLAHYALLPNGVHYVPGSASDGDPRLVTIPDPANPGYPGTALEWDNTGDLVINSTHTLTFDVSYNTTNYTGPERSFDVADTITIDAEAYVSDNPRDDTKWNPTTGKGLGPVSITTPHTFTGWALGGGTTTLSAIEVVKSEPSPEHELPRGVHDKQTAYTLTITNNAVNPTTGVSLEDFIPAGIEYLGCAGDTDNTTDAPTNPSATNPAEEYPGSGPIIVGPDGDHCVKPDRVETLGPLDPDGIGGPLPTGIYTHLRWDSVPGFAPAQSTTFTYRAAIPLRENTMTWTSGSAPDPLSGKQASNLDNNSGHETYDEQPLLNGAIVEGTYEPPSPKLPKHVSHEGTALVIAEDIAIQKSSDNHGLEVGDFTQWTLNIQVSEYRSVDDVTIEDTVPNGLCPIDPLIDVEHTPPASTTECGADNAHPPTEGPPAVGAPPAPYASVVEQPGGTYQVVWNKTTVASLAHVAPGTERQIKFWTKTREYYQGESYENDKPIVSRDSVQNAVQVNGRGWIRCTDTPTDCVLDGMKIDSDEFPDGQPDIDVSGSSKTAAGVTIDKQVALPPVTGGSCATATYTDTVPEYGPGDDVCWKIRVDFPTRVHTRSQHVRDFLPVGVSFVSQGPIPGVNTVTPVTFTTGPPLEWTLGTGGLGDDVVQLGPGVFEYYVETTAGSPLGHHSGDVEGNLMKFSYENTAGQAWALRDQADFKLKIPELSLQKGVAAIITPDGTIVSDGPNEDDKQVTGRDSVQFRLDVTNNGTADASSSRIVDELPPGITCADIVPLSISNGGMCIGSQIVWSSIPVAAGATVTLTYALKVPVDVSPCTPYHNVAGVVEAQYTTNTGATYQLIPDNPTVRDPSLPAANMPAAEDGSLITVRCARVSKLRTTSVTEGGNAQLSEAAIGEQIDYEVTVTIPEGTTMYGIPTVTDDLGPRQALVTGTPLTGTLNGGPLLAGMTLSASGSVITATFPATYANPLGDDVLVLTFSARVLDVDDNIRGSDLPNTATLSYYDHDHDDVPVTASGGVSTRIVEPKLAVTKSHTPSGTISAGQIVDFTVTVTNQAGPDVSTAHDIVVKDVLPLGTLPILTGANNDIAGSDNGHWVGNDSMITWDETTTAALASLAPGASVVLHYQVVIGSAPPVSGNSYLNAVHATASSLDSSLPGVRTPSSTSPTAPDYEARTVDVLTAGLPSVTKEVTPDKITIGDSVTWTLIVTLPRGLQYFDATVVDLIPDGFDFDGFEPVTPTTCPACPLSDPTVTPLGPAIGSGPVQVGWYLGDLPASTTDRVYTLVLHGHLRDTYANGTKVKDGQTLTNSAHVSVNVIDEVIGIPGAIPGTFGHSSDPATATNHVVEPKLTVHKSADKGPFIQGGDVVTYTIAITNTGTSPAYDVAVEDSPDSELQGITVTDPYNVVPWVAGGPPMRWLIPGPIAPGATVTLSYTAHVKPVGVVHADDQITNTADIDEYQGVPATTRNAHPWVFRPYDGPESTVTLTVAAPRITIEKTPDDCMVTAGSPSTFTITITNHDTHATAHNVVVTDVLDPGLTYAPDTATAAFSGMSSGGFSETSASGQSIAWLIATLEPGATVTITVPVGVGAGVPDGTVLVNTATAHDDEDPTELSDTGSLIVEAESDLRVTKVAEPGPVVAGTNVDYTMVVTNDGPADALQSKLVDVLPSYLSFVSLDDTTHCVVTGQTIECDFGTLAAGGTRTIHVTAKLDADRTTPIKNVVNVSTTTAESHDANNRAKATSEVAPRADVSIEKFADGALFGPGETVTYTLVAHNHGPSVAQGTTIDDDVPANLAFVSVTPGAPVCTYAAGHVHCDLGALAPGADRTVTIVTTANNVAASPGAGSTHTITMSKVEQAQLVPAGETRTADLTCGADGTAVDGSVRLPSFPSITDVHIEEARSIARGTYRFTVANASSQNVPVRYVVTCLPRATDPDTHTHELNVGTLQSLTTGPLAPGRHVRTVATAPGRHAVAPGIAVGSGVARLVGSEPGGSGRTFTIEVLSTADVQLSVRAIDDDTAPGGIPVHAHSLSFTHIAKEVSPGPGASEWVVDCPIGYAGVVSSFDLPGGLVSLGSEPHEPARVFGLLNVTSQTLHARIDVECLAIRTGDAVGVVAVANTATVDTTTLDPADGNDHDSVTVGVRPATSSPPDPGPGAGPGPGPGTTVTPVAPGTGTTAPVTTTTPLTTLSRVVIGTARFSANASQVTVQVKCPRTTTCRGRVTVTAPTPTQRRAAGAGKLKTITLGMTAYRIGAGKSARVSVKIAKRYRALLRNGRVRTVRITSGTASVTRRVVLPRKAGKAAVASP